MTPAPRAEHYRELAVCLRERASDASFPNPGWSWCSSLLSSNGEPSSWITSRAIDDPNSLGMTRIVANSVIVVIAIAVATAPLAAREYRSREVTREFQREHPCPSTGLTSGACPGYRKDHVIRSPVAALTRCRICNGRRSRRGGQGPLGTQGVRPLNKGVNGRRAAVTDQFGGTRIVCAHV